MSQNETSSTEKVYEMRACPNCGAAVSVDEVKCWLCQWIMAREVVMAEPAKPPVIRSLQGGWNADVIASVGSAVVLGLATTAAFFVAPGIGVLLSLLFVIVLFALAKSLSKGGARRAVASHYPSDQIQQAYATPITPMRDEPQVDTTAKIISQVLIAIGIALLVGIAAVIAFFTFCVICFVVLTNA